MAKILILGGYGNTGRRVGELLLRETDAEVVLAGRNLSKAASECDRLNRIAGTDRARPSMVDAADGEALTKECREADMLFVASSTSRYASEIARAALAAQIDYMDVVFSTKKTAALRALEGEIASAGCCFITDGGFHPGLPAAVAASLARHLDVVESAAVASIIRSDWKDLGLSASTMEEFAAEFGEMKPLKFESGRWQKAGLREMMKPELFDFGPPFGKQPCIPMFLEEMLDLPEQCPDLETWGFWIAGFNRPVDWVITPVVGLSMALSQEIFARRMGRLLLWGLERFSKPPYGTVLTANVVGKSDGRNHTISARLTHSDMYWFTAIPAFACLLQWLDGTIRKPGLWLQGTAVDPDRFMVDLGRLGIQVEVSGLPANKADAPVSM